MIDKITGMNVADSYLFFCFIIVEITIIGYIIKNYIFKEQRK